MTKLEKMDLVNKILYKNGIKEQSDYVWSIQGPTIIGIGDSAFSDLTQEVINEIKSAGVDFLIEPNTQSDENENA